MKKNIFILTFIVFLILVGSCTPTTAPPATENPYGEPFVPPTSTLMPPTITATLPIFDAFVIQPGPCLNGPSEGYLTTMESLITPGISVKVLAKIKDDPNWFMVEEPYVRRCWTMAFNLDVSRVDINRLYTFIATTTKMKCQCYLGPTEKSKPLTSIPKDLKVVLYLKNEVGDWILVSPKDTTQQCWVKRSVLNDFDVAALGVEPPELIPTSVAAAPIPTKKSDGGGNQSQATATSVPPSGVPPTPVPPTATQVPPTPIPPTDPPPVTATLCWPPGHCK